MEGIKETLGYVVAPQGKASTPDYFYFWAHSQYRIEKTQIVVSNCVYEDGEEVTFYGIVDEVAHEGEERSIHEDRVRRDGYVIPSGREIPLESVGTTYAKVKVLATTPETFTPVLSGSSVRFASPNEAALAHGFDKIKVGAPVGLLRNGAGKNAGPAYIDFAYLLGENGAHLNINGVSGVATKTSSMLVLIMSMLQVLDKKKRESPSAADNITVVPVLFNVKGYDMLWLDKESRSFQDEHKKAWEQMGLEAKPFDKVNFLVPAAKDNPREPVRVVSRSDLKPYSWGLGDIIKEGLLPFLFSAEDKGNQNFSHLLNTFEERFTAYDRNGKKVLRRREDGLSWNPDAGTPQTFAEWILFLRKEIDKKDSKGGNSNGNDYSSTMEQSHVATIRAFYRRLQRLRTEGAGVIAWEQPNGSPPQISHAGEHKMFVIDIASLARSTDMQRFVIAATLNNLKEQRTDADAARGIRYVIALDELNQWAPKGSHDATTALFEKIAAEMRSMGIILLGAQQFASQISLKVAENASCRMVGRTGPGELSDKLWQYLSDADKKMVGRLQQGEQLLSVPPFRAPAYITVPFPAWAMKYEDVVSSESENMVEVNEENELFIDFTGSNLFL